ncbi:hypothetical protein [Sedimenticola selenatireducens]|uniref:Uncharacterized protein n=1 Tax=Sedimenticola selenatireducens TaxID=191960 RepID=A0A558DUW6_9GAMM|nr:hypothetical protein [Sedimenticola selenatireducens]TVO72453.1 hypothetical protein FHP88_12725 [Sedimenticola selenatireducens]TVT64708.1 MAG: hypothetical protein FHK78_06490 [Sedimenticola selenatireducens]
MNAVTNKKQTLIVAALGVIALGLMAVIFYSPVWWVSLTAPNYPEEAFPDGVRIHFHMNGVFNGCEKVNKAEISEDVALDCVHEMDTINHYVGMYPIAAGGPVERGFGQFLMVFMGIMLVGFICVRPKLRMTIMSVGFAGLLIWMYLTVYGKDGFNLQSAGYVEAMVTSMDQEAGAAQESEPEIVIGGIVGVLKKSLEDSGVVVDLPSDKEKLNTKEALSDKAHMIEQLRLTYERDFERGRVEEPWNGSSFQVMSWHYGKSLGRYFNNQEEIVPMVANLKIALHVVFAGLAGAMLLLVFGARKNGGILYWLLVLVPMALPVFFIIDYAAWLWWYGHTLNAMGAFAVKPFMPTVFGDGKVAQFATHSYPYIGFFIMLVLSPILAVAALIRKKQFKDAQ